MTPQLQSLLKALRDLPYTDMMDVADAMSTELKGIHSGQHIAGAIAKLPIALDGPVTKTPEEEYFRKMGLSRKRSLTITPLHKGWIVEINGVPGAHAQHSELRMAIQQLLDQAVTAHVMMK
jgi:hypothetical protein